jgi:hypothetical protein
VTRTSCTSEIDEVRSYSSASERAGAASRQPLSRSTFAAVSTHAVLVTAAALGLAVDPLDLAEANQSIRQLRGAGSQFSPPIESRAGATCASRTRSRSPPADSWASAPQRKMPRLVITEDVPYDVELRSVGPTVYYAYARVAAGSDGIDEGRGELSTARERAMSASTGTASSARSLAPMTRRNY